MAATSAFSQVPSNSDTQPGYPNVAVMEAGAVSIERAPAEAHMVGVTAAAAHIPTIEAIAVQEPLQRRSAAVQRLWRARLVEELNRILPTRETVRGLVVTVPESLLPGRGAVPRVTSDKLARIAEIIPPDATVRVEGYTDDLGSTGRNLDGSCGRAEAVRDILVANDNASRSISATGFVSSARSASGANRRVEIVISGRVIAPEVFSRRAYALASR